MFFILAFTAGVGEYAFCSNFDLDLKISSNSYTPIIKLILLFVAWDGIQYSFISYL